VGGVEAVQRLEVNQIHIAEAGAQVLALREGQAQHQERTERKRSIFPMSSVFLHVDRLLGAYRSILAVAAFLRPGHWLNEA
jgi:hypothetical protein